MLQVLLARLGDLFAESIGRVRPDAAAEQALAAEEGRSCLSMRDHHHVLVVDAVAFLTVGIFAIFDKFPMLG